MNKKQNSYFLRKRKNFDNAYSLPDNPDDSDSVGDCGSSDENDDDRNCDVTESHSDSNNSEDSNSDESIADVSDIWSQDRTLFKNLNKTFERDPEVQMNFHNSCPEISYFFSLLTQEIIYSIVLETNSYAKESSDKNFRWKDISSEELQAWIGIHIIMGTHRLPSVKNYWST